MADMSKSEKLAVARRKLKEFQKKSKDTVNFSVMKNTAEPSRTETENHVEPSLEFNSGTGDFTPNELQINSPVSPMDGYIVDLPATLVEPVQEDAVVTSEMPKCDIHEVIARNSELNAVSVPEDSLISSSTESLRQLSLQVNGLLDDSVEVSGSSHVELEERNQELAALLASRDQRLEQLQLELTGSHSRISQLQTEIEIRLARELHPVQEQLQLHIQTVGILVGEKTELQAALSKSQQTAKQKAAEVQELQGRLKASRHRVGELEKELASLAGIKDKLEGGNVEQAKIVDSLKAENRSLKKQLEEVQQECAEARQKLSATSNECVALQHELQENRSQIDLLQLRVQQLSPDNNHVLEAMHQQKIGLEWQVSELQQTVKSLSVDREHATQQYQDYLQQFNTQLKHMADKLAVTSGENEQLVSREQNLVRHVSELEKQLQQLIHHSKEEPKEAERFQQLEDTVNVVRTEKQELAYQLEAQLQEKLALQDEIENGVKRIGELEAMLEAVQSDQPDRGRLLAAMESDKVAAAQAVTQNHKLKIQLEELQGSFIKMSNDKVELTEQLQHEQHMNKELGRKLHDIQNRLEEKETLLSAGDQNMKSVAEEQGEVQIEASSSQNGKLEALGLEQSSDVDPKSYFSTKEALEKLEQRFTVTMQEVAELSDEKQRLEHIVLQLQGETETIGEYIALYQVQRRMLQLRAQERDEQVTRLRKDREELKAKLNELTNLVQTLPSSKDPQGLMNGDEMAANEDNIDLPLPTSEATEKIMALISEIGSSSLVDPKDMESFHPCPWCSGSLITV